MTGNDEFHYAWVVEITDGIITYVGSAVGYEDKPGSHVIDANGKTIMPGIVDAYVRGTEFADPDFTGQSIRHEFLLDGVTTTCNTGHSLESAPSFDSGPAINGASLGRVYNSGPQVTFRMPSPPSDEVAEGIYEVSLDQAEIEAAIQEIYESGADYIKISIDQHQDPRRPLELGPAFSAQQIDQIVHQASAFSLITRGTLVDERYGVRAAQSQVQVIDFVPAFHSIDGLVSPSNSSPYIFAYTFQDSSQAETLDAARSVIIDLASAGKIMVPMISVMDSQYPWRRDNPDRSMYEEVVEFFRDRGGKVAYGSAYQRGDAPGLKMAEINSLQGAGMTNRQIITAITYHSALACGADKEIGTLAVGKKGDVIVLDSNVLDDITALQRPETVILDGDLVFSP